MARKHDAAEHLKRGLSPSMIARAMGVTTATVISYLYNQAGEGRIRRSEIAFAIKVEIRQEIDRIVKRREAKGRSTDKWYIRSYLVRKKWAAGDIEDAEIYLQLRDARIALGDMYESIYAIEVFLHDFIKTLLIARFGSDRSGWWRKGIPEPVRLTCVTTCETDPEPAEDAYCYTTFIHLKKIVDANWRSFVPLVPTRVGQAKHEFLQGLETLNGIRNRVMHPSKGIRPSEDDFLFVHSFLSFLELSAWKPPIGA